MCIMEKPLVSVIIAAYNAEQYIEETLDSILNQSHQVLEIIVVDDGSIDRTAEIVKAFHPRVRYAYQENSGSCASPRNHGLRIARGKYLTFFDADDIMLPKKIEQQVREMEENPSAVLCVINYCNFTGKTRSNDHFSSCPLLTSYIRDLQKASFPLNALESTHLLIEENFTIASSPLFRAENVVKQGGFDTSLKACEDFHLIYRVASQGSMLVMPAIGFERRLHNTNMSADSERMLRNLIRSRQSLATYETNPDLKLRLQKRVLRYHRDLQSCLINKGQLRSAAKIFKETFPPRSLSDLNHDFRQSIKLTLRGMTTAPIDYLYRRGKRNG